MLASAIHWCWGLKMQLWEKQGAEPSRLIETFPSALQVTPASGPQIVAAGASMRAAQRAFFRSRDLADMAEAQRLERAFDAMLATWDEMPRTAWPGQPTLF